MPAHGRIQHPVADGDLELGRLDARREVAGQHEAALRMLPPDQGLHPLHLAADEVHLRLEPEDEFLVLERPSDLFAL
jgi:hypothetical protein